MHFCKMLKKLQERWKVNLVNLILIILTFALGGSLCGWAGRKILLFTNLEKGVVWILLYIILVTLLWPLCVLLISIPFGQFGFFKKYISKILGKFRSKKPNIQKIYNIAVFASGAGSNAKKIIEYFNAAENNNGKVCMLVCNNPAAGALKIATENNIPALLINRKNFQEKDYLLAELKKKSIDFIVLAGFLWKIPTYLLKEYPKKIINIHPALLPKFGGKGMYGHHVHESVIANKEKQSGISIHYVDEIYDHGAIIFQAICDVTGNDTVETLSQKIHLLEHQHYPAVIDAVLQKQNPS